MKHFSKNKAEKLLESNSFKEAAQYMQPFVRAERGLSASICKKFGYSNPVISALFVGKRTAERNTVFEEILKYAIEKLAKGPTKIMEEKDYWHKYQYAAANYRGFRQRVAEKVGMDYGKVRREIEKDTIGEIEANLTPVLESVYQDFLEKDKRLIEIKEKKERIIKDTQNFTGFFRGLQKIVASKLNIHPTRVTELINIKSTTFQDLDELEKVLDTMLDFVEKQLQEV